MTKKSYAKSGKSHKTGKAKPNISIEEKIKQLEAEAAKFDSEIKGCNDKSKKLDEEKKALDKKLKNIQDEIQDNKQKEAQK